MKKIQLYKGVQSNLSKIEEKYRNKKPYNSTFFYYLTLILAVLTLASISIALFPFLLAINSFPLYILTVFFGIMFGLIFELLLLNNKELKKSHHLTAGSIIFTIAFILFMAMSFYANKIITDFPIRNIPHNNFLISIVYALSFISPYLLNRTSRLNLSVNKVISK